LFICDFGKKEFLKLKPVAGNIRCDALCCAGDSFGVATLTGSDGIVNIGAMICADREFPERATQLIRNGAEIIPVPNACTWDDIRTAGLETRAMENLVGIAMVNYPLPLRNGNLQAHACVAWRKGGSADTLIVHASETAEILIRTFDMDDIRAFRRIESWRLNYHLARAT